MRGIRIGVLCMFLLVFSASLAWSGIHEEKVFKRGVVISKTLRGEPVMVRGVVIGVLKGHHRGCAVKILSQTFRGTVFVLRGVKRCVKGKSVWGLYSRGKFKPFKRGLK